MANSYYKADDVKANVAIKTYLANQGIKAVGTRFKPTWRPSDRLSCAIYTKTNSWHDFVANTGGSVIDLAMLVEGLTFPEAVNALGERYGVPAADGTKRPPKKPKPKIVPDWVRVSWLIIHAEDDTLMRDAYEHLNEGGDYLTDADLFWTRRVAGFIQRGLSFGDTIRIAAEMCRQLAAKEVAA